MLYYYKILIKNYKMKKLLYIFLAVSFIFTACKKEEGCIDSAAINYNADAEEDDGSCTYPPSIVGIWTPTSVTQDSSLTTIIDGQTVTDLMGETLTYSGSITMTPEESGLNGNMEFTDNGLAITFDDISTYFYSNNVVTIIDEDGEAMLFTCTFTGSDILALSISNSMDTSYNEPGLIMLGYPEGNISISANASFTINCSRNTVVNTNVNQRVGEGNHSWFVKPKFDNILRILNKLKE
jgi:hypothetical protein